MRIPLTRIQRLIGERMLKSKQSKPCFYIESKADVTKLMSLRSKLSKSLGVKITTNAFYIRALAAGVKKYPIMVGILVDRAPGPVSSARSAESRATNDEPRIEISIADAVNVGFAVNAPQGLVVPVIRDADKKTLAEIARLEKLFTEKARSNKLTIEEMEAETIALSNLGVYGIDSFVGIVPPPVSTILAVGNILPTVIPEEGKPIVRKMVSLTLAVDHRVVSGAYAAEFLNFITEQLQNPQKLV